MVGHIKPGFGINYRFPSWQYFSKLPKLVSILTMDQILNGEEGWMDGNEIFS